MNRTSIIINDNGVTITPTNGTVWLSQCEIVNLFGVFTSKINSNIRAILRSGILRHDDVVKTTYANDGSSIDFYNLEMITALAFCIDSPQASRFRLWLMRKATTKIKQPIIIQCRDKYIS